MIFVLQFVFSYSLENSQTGNSIKGNDQLYNET